MAPLRDTSGLTTEQRAKVAYAVEMIRSTAGNVRGWSLYRVPETGGSHTIRLLKRGKGGVLEQVYSVSEGRAGASTPS